MKRFLMILFPIILTTSMLLAGVGCQKTVEAAAKTSLVKTAQTTIPETTAAKTLIQETTAPESTTTPETTVLASGQLDLGTSTVKDPDPEMMIESEVLGLAPAN